MVIFSFRINVLRYKAKPFFDHTNLMLYVSYTELSFSCVPFILVLMQPTFFGDEQIICMLLSGNMQL